MQRKDSNTGTTEIPSTGRGEKEFTLSAAF
jgi:hypothetical protein